MDMLRRQSSLINIEGKGEDFMYTEQYSTN